MLRDANVSVVLAVRDMEEARKFYGETLGLEQSREDLMGGITYRSGSGVLYIYPSEFAGTNKATAAGWEVTDIEATVAELKGRGVNFEQYDFPGATREGDIHVIGNIKSVWFKDPSGNILAISNGMNS